LFYVFTKHGRSYGLHDEEGFGDLLLGRCKLDKLACAGSDYWTTSASRCYFSKSKPTKQTENMYTFTVQ